MVSPSSPDQARSPQSWKEKIARQWWELKMLDTQVQLAKDKSRQRLVERLVRKTQDGTLGQSDGDGRDEDEVGMGDSLQVGDNNVHHHHPPPSPTPTQADREWITLGKAAMAVLVGATIAGAGYLAGRGLSGDTDTDTSLQFSLRPFEAQRDE